MTALTQLAEIQKRLRAPKSQVNKFGGYNYRSCEDILEAVKPLLKDSVIIVTDEIIEVGGRIYVKATATFKSNEGEFSTTAYAREPDTAKGSSESQITGAASSYARKYALNGLLLIDDNKDADATNKHGKEDNVKSISPSDQYEDKMRSARTLKELQGIWNQVNQVFKNKAGELKKLAIVKEEMKEQLCTSMNAQAQA